MNGDITQRLINEKPHLPTPEIRQELQSKKDWDIDERMMRKSQVSLFIILGLVVVIIIGSLYLVSSEDAKRMFQSISDEATLDSQGDLIEQYVESCLFDVAIDGTYLLGLQGGYIDPDYNEHYGDYDQVEYQRSGSIKIPHWYLNGNDISPSLRQMEVKLGRYIVIEAENCTRFENFDILSGTEIIHPLTEYPKDYPDIPGDKIAANVSINKKDISITFHYPLALQRKQNRKDMEWYHVIVPLALGEDYEIAQEVLNKMAGAGAAGYNLEPDCGELNRGGYVNVFPFNGRILLIDYEPHFNPRYGKSLKLQYLYSGVPVYGYCSG